jgi:hypothetical protein|tara:strand:+ start:216 stop:509 length:294 start_codon:yes stop_codon:yes gene_type:complete
MGYNDDLVKKRDGSYILKHKTKKAKEGDCVECGQNSKNRPLGGLYRYNTEDMVSVREYIENHLRTYSRHKSIKPIWCNKCQALIIYTIMLDTKQNYL